MVIGHWLSDTNLAHQQTYRGFYRYHHERGKLEDSWDYPHSSTADNGYHVTIKYQCFIPTVWMVNLLEHLQSVIRSILVQIKNCRLSTVNCCLDSPVGFISKKFPSMLPKPAYLFPWSLKTNLIVSLFFTVLASFQSVIRRELSKWEI